MRIDAPLDDTVPAKRAITLRDLLTFRSGYGMIMAFPDRYPVQKAIAEAGFAPGPVFPSFPPDELMRRYGSLPLVYQPGERWLYSAGTEILGVLIARVAGKTFGEFLDERIFAPLGHEGHRVPCAGGQASPVRDQLWPRSQHAGTESRSTIPSPASSRGRRRSRTAAAGWSRPPTISMPSRR